ncbi:MAG: PAS domain S-box protein, partial [bacterium]
KILEKTNSEIITISSGSKAIELIPQIRPALIISDYVTEDMDGCAVFKQFRQSKSLAEYHNIPFIIISDREVRNKYSKEFYTLGISGWFSYFSDTMRFRECLENIMVADEWVRKNKELSQEIKRSEYRYRDLLENANDFIFTLDQNGKFVYLNNRFKPLTGFKKKEWLQRDFSELILEQDRKRAIKNYQLVHQGRARIFQAQIMSNISDCYILSFNITPIFEHGSIVGSMGLARDVTEQKMMENEILELKNFNESIIQSMEAGLLTVDLNGFITSLNTGGERILGWKAEEVLGEKIKSVLIPKEVDILLMSSTKPGALPYSRETQLTVKSGEKISIGFTTTDRIDNLNNKVGTIISFRDISELKQMQNEVKRMERLASLGILASGIAHEIKNPLAGIKSLSQTCKDEFEPDDSRLEYLTRIINQVNRLDELLKAIVAFARPKPPDRKSYDIKKVIHEVINLIIKKFKTNNINYIEDIDDDLPIVVIDPQQIQQVFLNLMLNAIDAINKNGSITVSAKPWGFQLSTELLKITMVI